MREALAGTEENRDGMLRTEIKELADLPDGTLSRALAKLELDGTVLQTNAPQLRHRRFKLKTAEDSVVVRLRAGEGEIV